MESIKIQRKHLQITLNLLFSSEDRKNIAYSLLSEIKVRQRQKSPYKASERLEFCEKNRFDPLVYDQVLHNLKKHGLVRKEGNSILLSTALEDEWRKFMFE